MIGCGPMKTKPKIKPRRMWTGREEFTNPSDVVLCGNKKEFADDICVAVIPLDDPLIFPALAALGIRLGKGGAK